MEKQEFITEYEKKFIDHEYYFKSNERGFLSEIGIEHLKVLEDYLKENALQYLRYLGIKSKN